MAMVLTLKSSDLGLDVFASTTVTRLKLVCCVMSLYLISLYYRIERSDFFWAAFMTLLRCEYNYYMTPKLCRRKTTVLLP